MRKILSLLLVLALQVQAAPPLGLAGQSQSVTYPAVHKVPYNQTTSLGGINSLIETGNENMLVDPGMESANVTAWTCTSGTCTKTSVSGEFSSGKQALKVALSAQAMDVSQTVSTPLGIQKQGYFRILYRIPASGIVTPTMTITVDSVLQTTVPSTSLIMDGTFRQIEVPLIFGATNVKVAMLTGSSTGTIFLDAAIVAQGLGTQNLMLDNVYSAQVTTTSGAIANQNKTFIASCTAVNPSVCTFTTGIFTVAPNCTASDNVVESGVSASAVSTATTVTVLTTNTATGGYIASKPVGVICQKSGNDYLASSANVYSQASAGTEAIYAKTSSSAVLDGTAEARFTLAGISTSNKGFIQVQDDAPNTRTKFVALKESIANVSYTALQGSIGQEAAIYKNGAVFTSSNTAYASGTFVTIAASVPLVAGDFISLGAVAGSVSSYYFSITATPSTNYILGPFSGYTNVPGYSGSVDTFSVSYGTTNASTVCSASPCSFLDQIGSAVTSVTRSGVGTYALNTAKTYTKLRCSNNTNNVSDPILCTTSCSTASFTTRSTTTGTAADSLGTIMCTGSY